MNAPLLICLGCALVAVSNCQDLTSLILQAMGVEGPVLPPVMPQSLREHLYPQHRRQRVLEQQQVNEQRRRYLAYLSSQQSRQQAKANPYSSQPRDNSVYSTANKIRYPGSPNSVRGPKGNPYSSSQSSRSGGKEGSRLYRNPYSVSRGGSDPSTAMIHVAPQVPIPPQAVRIMSAVNSLRQSVEQPHKVADAKTIGCTMPSDSAAAAVLMVSSCRQPAAQMICQAEMMSCMKIGMSSMCCPSGVNNFALDAVGYVNKLQQFVAEFA